ncbi:hypothetical protein [Roseibacillus ishigakijimensis]|uniref:SH3 domain-containing protein n=1 Tax=Roseibacillus ishigakijimensis TaxID=454146 RepID=A0A934RQW5_9BACT|nr:hypothetical protein [Roseibacillus ishigakijimensis]MBK1833966.1 hypothetical protein [Roseibacillus ishigakijimensis]
MNAKISLLVHLLVPLLALAEDRSSVRRSLIDSDPEVVYVADLFPEGEEVELTVASPAHVYATKTGGRKLGVLTEGKVKLIGFDNRACKVQGQGRIGWVKPSLLRAREGNVQELMKEVYAREMEVRALIDKGEIALGMTRDEVCRVMGEPTKKTLRRSKEGVSGTLEFAEYEEVKHYQPVVDPYTGAVYRRYTHTTQEEKSKVVVEFENGVATVIEENEQQKGGDVKVVLRPVVWVW